MLLTPIVPAPTGNGLAMRSNLFRTAAARAFDVRTVVVPVAGALPAGVPLPNGAVVVPPDPARARAGIATLVAERAWRTRLATAGTMPAGARAASPGLVDAVVGALGPVAPAAVHVMRSYLAPLGVAVAERLGAPWTTLDLDDDDAALARAAGDPKEAAAYDRLLAVFCPLFAGLSAASSGEAVAIAARHGVSVQPIRNAVAIPPEATRRPGPAISLLYVGNLTYAPNVEAATLLAEEILPEVASRLGQTTRVTLAGPCDARVVGLAGANVDVAGFLPDLGPAYASADVVVVPLRVGAGTRIKLLEAFARDVPVVATRAAAAGLDVVDGRHLLLVDSVRDVPRAVERVVRDASLASRLVTEAARLVRERYAIEVVLPEIGALFERAAGATATS